LILFHPIIKPVIIILYKNNIITIIKNTIS
jgi:hypothetical protein